MENRVRVGESVTRPWPSVVPLKVSALPEDFLLTFICPGVGSVKIED